MKRHELQAALLVAVAAFPLIPGTGGLLGSGAQAAVFTLIAASLVLLTGWVGQISLAQAAFVGVGAYATGWAATDLGLLFPLTLPFAALISAAIAVLLGVVAMRVRGLYLAVATLIFSWAASEFLFRQPWVLERGTAPAQTIGDPGTLLHLDFNSRMVHYYIAWAIAVAVLYALVNLRDSRTGRAFHAVRGSEMAAASLGMHVLRTKTLAFALSGAIAGIAGCLTMTHARVVSPDSFDVADSLFFLAIAVVGGLTSLAGGVAAAIVFAAMSESFFRVDFLNAFLELASAVLLALIFRLYPGGLASLGREGLSRSLRLRQEARRIPEVLRRWAATPAGDETAGSVETVEIVMSDESDEVVEPATVDRAPPADGDTEPVSDGADVPTRRLPSLSPFVDSLRRMRAAAAGALLRVVARADRRTEVAAAPLALNLDHKLDHDLEDDRAPEPETDGDDDAPVAVKLKDLREVLYDPATRDERDALIAAENVTVRFGGLTAVDDASLTVREGEITGLIGPNGAGKTTLFNTVAGFLTPDEGHINLFGQNVTGMPVHERAQLGVARTFQLIQLFPELTVFDNLLAATHTQNPTGFVQHAAVTQRALHAELAARARVRRVLELLELEEVADREVAGLPFGILRMVEVARALVMGGRVIMLDEPASGLDDRETDLLIDVLRFVRSLGASLLLIEHDVRMVTAVTDYIHVLNRGRIIAEGTPDEIQRNPDVVAAYLGGALEAAEVG